MAGYRRAPRAIQIARSIRFGYRCFDRILINGLIQPFQQPERVVGFFNTYRQQYPVSKAVLTDIATQYQRWVVAQATAWRTPIVEAPAGRRDAFVEPYFRRAKPDHVAVIVNGREPARILIAIGKEDRWHLQYARRWVIQYNFYLNDAEWGRMFVRLCPYFPFPHGSVSISITGSPRACRRKACGFARSPMRS